MPKKLNCFSRLCSLAQDKKKSKHAREWVCGHYPAGAHFPSSKGLPLGDNVNIHSAQEDERITTHRVGSSFVYKYLFALGFQLAIDPIIKEICRIFNICVAQMGSSIWRLLACLCFLSALTREDFTLNIFPTFILRNYTRCNDPIGYYEF